MKLLGVIDHPIPQELLVFLVKGDKNTLVFRLTSFLSFSIRQPFPQWTAG